MPHINWWAGARLYLSSPEPWVEPEEIANGQLGDIVALAIQQPPVDRPRLFIVCENKNRVLPWAKIASLAADARFPVFI